MKLTNRFLSMKALLLLAFTIFSFAAFSQNKYTKLDTWMKDNVEDLGGRAVLMIWKDGKVLYSHSENKMTERQKMVANFLAKRQGSNAEEASSDFSPNSKVRIASCSKWLSAALLMTFVDEGKVNLEDTIGKFLPVMSKNGKGQIKVWQCLSHLTGIKGPQGKDSWSEMASFKNMDEAIAAIALQPVEGESGKTFRYGNTGLQIAAGVIEKVGGKSFETLFQERIAKPCNMKSTDYGNKAVPLAAGGAFSTAEDYINFLIMILNDGQFNGKQVLSKKSVIAMQHNYAKGATVMYSPAETTGFGYGFGEWTMDETPIRSDAVTSPGLFGSFPWVDNKKHYVGMLLTFNIKSEGRNERYKALKTLTDQIISQ